MRAGAIALALGLGLGLPAGAALGGEPEGAEARIEEARRLFAEAEEAERQGRYAEALAALRRVEAIKATPGVLFHVANCLENLGRLVEALETFERSEALARREGVDDVLALAGSRIAPLRARTPTVTVRAPRAGLRGRSLALRVDGELRPAIPDEAGEVLLRLDPGEHLLELRAEGLEPAVRRLLLEIGARETWEIQEARQNKAPSAPPAAPARPDRRVPRLPSAPVGLSTGAFVAGGAALALGIGGAFAFAAASSKNAEAEGACASAGPCEPGEASDVRLLDRLALGLWVGAAGASVLTLTLLATAPAEAPRRAPPAGPAARLRLGPARLALEGAF